MTVTMPFERSLAGPAAKSRIQGIDFLRGIVMIVMALDHTRDLIHSQAFTGDPLDLQTTTPLLFFTRWITHFCAPVFVFLSGTSAYLQSLRKDRATLSRFLIKRGLWLIVAEVVIITLGLTFNVFYSTLILQVIWAIGISMVVLGLAVWLPFPALLALGAVIVLGHNSLDYYERVGNASFPWWYHFLHRPAVLRLGAGRTLNVFYPFLPWTGLMIMGFCFGRLYKDNSDKKQYRTIALLGMAVTGAFILLRFINLYGDPTPWFTQKNALYTVMSFLNVQKYPPSLMYMCMTIGPALVFLGSVGNLRSAVSNIVTVFGRVPFFYYIAHFYLIHFISALLFLSRGYSVHDGMFMLPGVDFKFLIPGQGYSLRIVYLLWFCAVLLLYPACKWYDRYKRTHIHWWLGYL